MNQCKTTADVYREFARVLDMCEGTTVCEWDCVRYSNGYRGYRCDFNEEPSKYSFAIAIVEDKPVFVGDELYLNGKRIIVEAYSSAPNLIDFWSWTPKKKTFTLNGKEFTLPDGSRHDYTLGMYASTEKCFYWKDKAERDAVLKAFINLLSGEKEA